MTKAELIAALDAVCEDDDHLVVHLGDDSTGAEFTIRDVSLWLPEDCDIESVVITIDKLED